MGLRFPTWNDIVLDWNALSDQLHRELGVPTYDAASAYASEQAAAGASTDSQAIALQGAMAAEDAGAVSQAEQMTADQLADAAKGALSAFTLPLILAVAALGLWFLGPFIKKELPK